MEYNLPISDNSETHTGRFYNPYRNNITYIINKFLKEKSAF
jgi:hypothetical protein